ncbi:hypothetical protein D3C84_1227880 [compost metagenome]
MHILNAFRQWGHHYAVTNQFSHIEDMQFRRRLANEISTRLVTPDLGDRVGIFAIIPAQQRPRRKIAGECARF